MPFAHKCLLSQFHTCPDTSLSWAKWTTVLAISSLVGREFSLIEKVTYRDEPNRFDGVYENEFIDNPVRNTFIEQGEKATLWAVDTEFKFKTFMMKWLGPLLKKNFVRRTQRDMERFQEFAESQQEA